MTASQPAQHQHSGAGSPKWNAATSLIPPMPLLLRQAKMSAVEKVKAKWTRAVY